MMTADQAKALGLINKVVVPGQLMESALAWADAIAMNAPKAEATTKSLMCKFSGQAIAMSMTEYTAAPHITDETRSGLESFFDKKPVPWSIKSS
jgi:enoyl-CoA hydratase/carnithine racemase